VCIDLANTLNEMTLARWRPRRNHRLLLIPLRGFGMAGGMILLGVLLNISMLQPGMTLFSIIQLSPMVGGWLQWRSYVLGRSSAATSSAL